MKRVLAIGVVGAVMLATMGLTAIPASAHFEVGVNCHMNEIELRAGGTRLHFEMRIANRSQETHRNRCEFRFKTSAETWDVWRTCTLPGRTFCVRRGNINFDGDFRWWRWTHGHVV